MKKVYKIEVDCPNCANKIQNAVSKIEGVKEVSINFMTQKMIVDIDENNETTIYKQVIKTAKKIEPDFCVIK